MREAFITRNFTPKSRDLIQQCNTIVTTYQRRGLRMSLRQLYYQLVTRNVIKNSEQSYKALGGLLGDARMAGMVDWNAIEDRVRVPRAHPEYEDAQELMNEALGRFRLQRRDDQPFYVELWVEKDALSNILSPLAVEAHAVLMVNKGYSSLSAMYEASKRFIAGEKRGQPGRLLYLGDHDPSGEDMVRDLRKRLGDFGCDDLEVIKVALTHAQVRKYNPPPNPAKTTDSRFAKYQAKFGDESWEVDALDPDVLEELVRKAFAAVTDFARMRDIVVAEKRQRHRLAEIAEIAEAISKDEAAIADIDVSDDEELLDIERMMRAERGPMERDAEVDRAQKKIIRMVKKHMGNTEREEKEKQRRRDALAKPKPGEALASKDGKDHRADRPKGLVGVLVASSGKFYCVHCLAPSADTMSPLLTRVDESTFTWLDDDLSCEVCGTIPEEVKPEGWR